MKTDPLDKLFAAARQAQSPGEPLSDFALQRIARHAFLECDREAPVIPILRFGFAASIALACLTLLFARPAERTTIFEEVTDATRVSALAYYQ